MLVTKNSKKLLAFSAALSLSIMLNRVYIASAQEKSNPVKNGAKSTDTSSGDKTKWATIDAMDWQYSEKTGEHTGVNFTYKEEDTTITGARLKYNDKKDILDAEGSLTLDDPKHSATGDKAHIENGKKKLAVITGSVVIILKPDTPDISPTLATTPITPKPTVSNSGKTEIKTAPVLPPSGIDTEEDKNSVHKTRSEGGTVSCDRVEDFYKRKFVIMRGHLVFKQKVKKKTGDMVERTLTAEHAEYDGKKEEMELFAPVNSLDTDGRELHFEKNVIVGTKEGEESLQSKGKVKMKVPIDNSDDETETDPKANPAPETKK